MLFTSVSNFVKTGKISGEEIVNLYLAKEVIYHSGGDWLQNEKRPIGISEDMKQGIKYSKDIVNKLKNDGYYDITFIGHSKGGAEATGGAMATNQDALIFNPASFIASEYGINSSDYTGQIDAYIVDGEILTSVMDDLSAINFTFGGIGFTGNVSANLKLDPIIERHSLESSSGSTSTYNHSMDAVMEGIIKWQEN